MTEGEKLEKIREYLGLSQSKFGDLLGIKSSFYSQLKNNQTGFPKERLASLLELCKVNLNWFLANTGNMFIDSIEKTTVYGAKSDVNRFAARECLNDNISFIPLVEPLLSAGNGDLVHSENVEDRFSFKNEWLHRVSSAISNLYLFKIDGDSMSPTINNGDMALIDVGKKDIVQGAIFAVAIDNSLFIKRLQPQGEGNILVFSDNPSFREFTTSDIRIIGRVIWIGREFVKNH